MELSSSIAKWADASIQPRRNAVIAALAVCSSFGLASLLVPPGMYADSGWGFVAWRGTLMGYVNSTLMPSPTNIAHDVPAFLSMWSPGQYLAPGIISLLGIPLGAAISITVTLASISSIFGWLRVVDVFAPRASKYGVILVLLLATFRYVTLPFGIYNGGEILLQAATPWIVLGAFRVSEIGALRAATLSAGIVLVGFLAKLSGLIVASAALGAAGLVVLTSTRKVSKGMVSGAFGALVMGVLISLLYISRGVTAAEGLGWAFPVNKIASVLVFPWLAGMSWTDLMDWILLNPSRLVLSNSDVRVWFVLPVALCAAMFISGWCPQTELELRFKKFVFLFYVITCLIFVLLFAHGAGISIEERHFRPAGELFFVGGFIYAVAGPLALWRKYAFLAFCCLMSVYGIGSYVHRTVSYDQEHSLDRASWIQQPLVDLAAIDFIRASYVSEGRDAIYVLPSPEISMAMPLQARILAVDLDFTPEEEIASLRYMGRARGHVYVMMQNRIAESMKGHDLLAAFVNYAIDGWRRVTFASTSVFIQ